MEGYKIGKIIEVYRVTAVQKIDGKLYQFCISEGGWVSKSECFQLAKIGSVELEACLSDLGTPFLRRCPKSFFQKKLEDLIEK